MSTNDSINHQQIAQDMASTASQYAQYQLEYQNQLAQQKLIQMLHQQNSETAGGEILGLGGGASFEVLNKAINSNVGQELIKRGKQFYNDYDEVGFDGAKKRLYSSIQQDLMDKANEAKAKLNDKVNDLKAQAQEKVTDVQNDIQGRVDDAQQQMADMQQEAQDRVQGLQQDAENVMDDAQNRLTDYTTNANEQVASLQNNLEQQGRNLASDAAQAQQEGALQLNRGIDSIQEPDENLNNVVNNMFDFFGSRQPLDLPGEAVDPEAEFGVGDILDGAGVRPVYSSLNINPSEILQSLQSNLSNQANQAMQSAQSSLTSQSAQIADGQLGVQSNQTTDTITPAEGITRQPILSATTEPIAGQGANVAEATAAEAGEGVAEGASEAIPSILDIASLGLDFTPAAIFGGLLGAGGLIASLTSGLSDLFGGHDDEKNQPPPPLEGLQAEQIGTS